MSLSFQDALALYLTELEQIGRAKSTLHHNRRWLPVFIKFCQQQGLTEVQAITAEHVFSFHRHMTWTPGTKVKLLKQSTLYQCLQMNRLFLRWLHSEGHLLRDVTRSWILPRPPDPNTRVLTVEEMAKLLLTPNETRKIGVRDRAVLELLYGTGLRSAECCSLRLEHLDLEGSQLHVNAGQGRTDRCLPLGARLKQVLKRYLKVRAEIARDGEQALIVSFHGNALTAACLGELISRKAKAAGLKPFRSHAIRRSFATHLLDNGASIAVIGALLGHKNLSSTHLYTRVTLQELKKAYLRTHPRARRQTHRIHDDGFQA